MEYDTQVFLRVLVLLLILIILKAFHCLSTYEKIFLTKKGFEDLKKDYEEIVNKRRPEVVERLSAAREMGTFSLKTRGPRPQEVSGKYVVVWEKVGNDWKLATEIWNEGN